MFTPNYTEQESPWAQASPITSGWKRDYNLGSGYSVKAFTGLAYDKRWAFLIDLENYHIFTWKGYERI